MDRIVLPRWLRGAVLLLGALTAGLSLAAPASAYTQVGVETVTGTYIVNGQTHATDCTNEVAVLKSTSGTFTVTATGQTSCSTGNVSATGNVRIVNPFTQPNTTLAQGPTFTASPLNGATPQSAVTADMSDYPATDWFTGRLDVTLTLPSGIGAKWVAASTGNSVTGPGGCVLVDITAYCSLQSAPFTVGPRVPIGLSPGTSSAIAAISGISTGDLYSPTDPTDGDPGGAGAGVVGPDTFTALTATPTGRALLSSQLVETTAGRAVLDSFASARTKTSYRDTFTSAAGGVGACAGTLWAQTVAHTRRTAVAFNLFVCSESVNIAASFNWFSLTTGAFLDSSADATHEPESIELMASVTRQPPRGHRTVDICPSYEPEGGSFQARPCKFIATVGTRGV